MVLIQTNILLASTIADDYSVAGFCGRTPAKRDPDLNGADRRRPRWTSGDRSRSIGRRKPPAV